MFSNNSGKHPSIVTILPRIHTGHLRRFRIRLSLLLLDVPFDCLCTYVPGSAKNEGTGRVAIDLGETILMTCAFDDGTASLYPGRSIKAIRRYWQKIRANLKQNARRWVQISHCERKQVYHLLHIATSHFISECVKKRGKRNCNWRRSKRNSRKH
jgi:Probable transposase